MILFLYINLPQQTTTHAGVFVSKSPGAYWTKSSIFLEEMDELWNAFSVLELDMEDDKEHTMIATAADGDGERVKEQGLQWFYFKDTGVSSIVPLFLECGVKGLLLTTWRINLIFFSNFKANQNLNSIMMMKL